MDPPNGRWGIGAPLTAVLQQLEVKAVEIAGRELCGVDPPQGREDRMVEVPARGDDGLSLQLNLRSQLTRPS